MIPLHYVDSCIFFEVFSISEERLRQMAQKYFYDIDKKWHAIISSLTLGEITEGILKLPEQKDKEGALFNIDQHLEKFDIFYPQFQDYELSLELRKIHYHLEPADALHLAMAINNKAQFFVTLGERELINNEKIKEFCRNKGLRFKTLEG